MKKDDYFIPVKKAVRIKEKVSVGNKITVKYSAA